MLLLVRQIAHTTSHNSADKVSLVTIGQQVRLITPTLYIHPQSQQNQIVFEYLDFWQSCG